MAKNATTAVRLKIVDGGCGTTMGCIVEDPDGQLLQANERPLADDPTAVVIVDDGQWLLFDCPGTGSECLQAGTYQLDEWVSQLSEARETESTIEVRV